MQEMWVQSLGQEDTLEQEMAICSNILFFFFNNVSHLFWLCWVFPAARTFLWCSEQGLLFLAVPFLLQSIGSSCVGFRSCGTWAQQLWLSGFRAQAQQMWHLGLVVLWHVGPSWIRIEPVGPALAGRFFTTDHQGSLCSRILAWKIP